MSLKYRILIIFVIAVFSRSSAQFCSRSYVNGKWISKGDCGGAEMMSDIMRDLQRRSEEENKKCTVGNSGNSGKCDYCNHHPNTCQPGGKCLNYDNHPYYTCDCTDGYYGKNCSQKYCEHHPNHCQHNGTCLNNNTHPYHTCNCTDGYYGKNCSENFCEHHPDVCQHNGTCLKNVTHPYYSCDCTDGYYGKNCSQNYCEHHPNVCQHNGACLSTVTHPYYSCNCTDGYYGKNCSGLARSCEDAQLESARNDFGGVFKLNIPEIGITNVFCDVTDDGGNWTVFQRRVNGYVDFNRGWDDYVNGFGDLQGDHWLGLEALHQLTKTGNMEMKIKMITRDGVYSVAKYRSFSIGPAFDQYRLHVSGFSGNATDDQSNNNQFATYDNGDDGSCASQYESGWWHDGCGNSNLNGNFNKTGVQGLWWRVPVNSYHLWYAELKMRERASRNQLTSRTRRTLPLTTVHFVTSKARFQRRTHIIQGRVDIATSHVRNLAQKRKPTVNVATECPNLNSGAGFTTISSTASLAMSNLEHERQNLDAAQ